MAERNFKQLYCKKLFFGIDGLKRIKPKCCGLSKYIRQSVQEEFYNFHSPELPAMLDPKIL